MKRGLIALASLLVASCSAEPTLTCHATCEHVSFDTPSIGAISMAPDTAAAFKLSDGTRQLDQDDHVVLSSSDERVLRVVATLEHDVVVVHALSSGDAVAAFVIAGETRRVPVFVAPLP